MGPESVDKQKRVRFQDQPPKPNTSELKASMFQEGLAILGKSLKASAQVAVGAALVLAGAGLKIGGAVTSVAGLGVAPFAVGMTMAKAKDDTRDSDVGTAAAITAGAFGAVPFGLIVMFAGMQLEEAGKGVIGSLGQK